jgi:hypothetical protein
MHTGETERLPANVQILTASIVFTLISYFVFRVIWGVSIPLLFLFAILALQALTALLGNGRVFTPLGASSVAIFLSIAAYFAAVILLFPSAQITRFAGIAGGTASALFVLTSTIAAFRVWALDLEVRDAPQIEHGENEDLSDLTERNESEPGRMDLNGYPDEVIEREYPQEDPIDLTEGTETLKIAGSRDRDGFTAHKQAHRQYEYVDMSSVPYDISITEEPQIETPVLPEGVMEPEGTSVENPEALRFTIYERRTMGLLGEYIPEGKQPRLDRLALYRMFPEYDFRTFQIDSIRWLEGEVRILIKGEKKKDQQRK